MYFFAILGGIAAGFAFLFYTRKAEAKEVMGIFGMTRPDSYSLDYLFEKYGAQYGVDPLLLKAVATVESNLKADAVRDNPPYDISVGVMQILCIPNAQGLCTNKLIAIDGWPATFEGLKDAEINIRIGAQILARNIQQYGYPRGVAVYNMFAARHASVKGPFPNDAYVSKVLYQFDKLKGSEDA